MTIKNSAPVTLDPKQTEAVVDSLEKKGATFFNWDQLKEMIKRFGPETKMVDVKKQLSEGGGEKKG